MINLFNIDIDRIIHNGAPVTLMMLDGVIIYENIPFSLTFTVHNDISGGLGKPFTNEIPGFFSFDPSIGYALSGFESVLVTQLDGNIVDITNNYTVSYDNIAKVQVYYLENVYMIQFSNMEYIKTVNHINLSNLTSFRHMFYNCTNLESVNTKQWDTSKITGMGEMFSGCESLTELDLSSFYTSNVTDMYRMFCFCKSLTKLDLRNFDTRNVSNMDDMFGSCESLRELRLDNCSYNTINTIINNGGLPTDEIDGGRFIYCQKENAGDLEPPQNWTFIFIQGSEIPEIPFIPDYKLYVIGQFKNSTETAITVFVDERYTDLKEMFYGCSSLTTINGIEYWDTSNVTDMEHMFYNCKSLTELDLSSFDTSNLTDMYRMFCYCENLTTLDLSSFDMINVTGFMATSSTFFRCYALTNLQAPQNINKSIDFSDCTNLTHDSLMSIINNLTTITSTEKLELGETNLAKLTDEEKAIATQKGWTLA